MTIPIKTTADPKTLPAPHFANRTLYFRVEGQGKSLTYEAKFIYDTYRTPKRPQKFAIRAHAAKEENGRTWEVKGSWCYFSAWADVADFSRRALETLMARIVERVVQAAYEQEAMGQFRNHVASAYSQDECAIIEPKEPRE